MMASAGKEAIWLACKQKACCHTTIVPTGRDVWRIARGLDVPLRSFLVYFESAVERRDAFHLDRSGRRFRLALARQPARRTGAAPCIFLLHTRQRHHRCALGSLRPLLCRSYPANVADGIVRLDAEGCTCRSWSLADVDIAGERALVAERQAEAEEYCRVVAAWNAGLPADPAEGSVDFGAYCEYLLTTYDSVAKPGMEASDISG
jgi:Fe-S-cluster containining protein